MHRFLISRLLAIKGWPLVLVMACGILKMPARLGGLPALHCTALQQVNSVLVADSTTLFVGTEQDGIFRSQDGGRHLATACRPAATDCRHQTAHGLFVDR